MRSSSKTQISALVVAAAVLVGGAGELQAQNEVTWVYEGTIIEVDIDAPIMPGDPLPFAVGDAAKAIITYDLDTMASSEFPPITADYDGAVTGLVALFGSYTATGFGGRVGVVDNFVFSGVPIDEYQSIIDERSSRMLGELDGDIAVAGIVATPKIFFSTIQDRDGDGNCFAGTNLRATPPDPLSNCGTDIGTSRSTFRVTFGESSPDGFSILETRAVVTSVTLAGPADLVTSLAGQIMSLNLATGISNGLDSKLTSAMDALDDMNANNDAAAAGSLDALIHAIQAQSGKKIPTAEADQLIAQVQMVIDMLLNP